MCFHPDKCFVLPISNKTAPCQHTYYLRGHALKHVDETKYLGITLSSDLHWGSHVIQLCKKANRTMGFLKRNLNISSCSVKETAYKTLVRPLLEFASSAWDPGLQVDINRLQMVQRRAARYTLNRYHNRSSVSEMLDQLKWPTLQQRRKNARLVMLYRLTNGYVQVDASDRLVPPNRLSRGMHEGSFQTFSTRCEARRQSFYPRTVQGLE